MSMVRKKILAAGIVVLLCAALALSAGCNSPNQEPSLTYSTPSASEAPARSTHYASDYPLQYASLQQTRVNAKGITVGHAAAHLQHICESPTVRDHNGDPVLDENGNEQFIEAAYDSSAGTYSIDKLSDEQLAEMNLRTGCTACKTTRFQDVYAQQGAAAFGNVYNAEARAIVDGDYFDCGLCHKGNPEDGTLEAGLMFFPAVGASLADRLDPRNGVCGQCHNYLDYRSTIRSNDDLHSIDAYRYGFDVDALFETSWEDGVNFDVDEETGIAESYVLHPTIELFLGTGMQQLGMTCVDCHMPKADEEGVAFTDHFSANSPLENSDSLAYCLTCHERQGIGSASEMVAYTREAQSQLAEGTEALQEREAQFKQKLEQAIAQHGKDNPALDRAKKLYAKVTWYEKCLVTGPNESLGSQAAMLNWREILDKGNAACDEGMGLLG